MLGLVLGTQISNNGLQGVGELVAHPESFEISAFFDFLHFLSFDVLNSVLLGIFDSCPT